MKKFLLVVLAVAVSAGVFQGCSKKETPLTTEEFKNAEDIEKMSGTELYGYSLSLKKKVSGAVVSVTENVTESGETKTSTTQISANTAKRDNYYFCQISPEMGCTYYKQYVYISNGGANFCKKMTVSEFTEYYESQIGDKWYIGAGFEICERDGTELNFRKIADYGYLSLISGIAENKITDAAASAVLGENLLINSAKIVVKSDETEYNAEIKLIESGEDSVTPERPDADPENPFFEVTDLKAPVVLNRATENFNSLNEYEVTVNSSVNAVIDGKGESSFDSSSVEFSKYSERLFKIDERKYSKYPDGKEINIETQITGENGKLKYRHDDLLEQKKIDEYESEVSEEDMKKTVSDYVSSSFFSLKDFSSVVMTETFDSYALQFETEEDKAYSVATKGLELLLSLKEEKYQIQNFVGSIVIDKESECIKSISYSFTVAFENSDTCGITYSMTVNKTNGVTVREIFEPDYSIPELYHAD